MCDYCSGYIRLNATDGGFDVISIFWMPDGRPVIMVDRPHDYHGSWSIPINFCPFCGRKLGESK